jgi:hypothetical protein
MQRSPPFIASNEIVDSETVEPVCGSVGVGDGVADTVFISVVDPHHGCPWTVRAKKGKDDSWRITSVVQPHTC